MNSQSRAAFAAVVFVFASLAAPALATKDNSYFNTHGLGYVQTGNQVRGDGGGRHVLLWGGQCVGAQSTYTANAMG